MSDTALELTAEERALIESRRAGVVEPEAATVAEPDAFDGRCGAYENPKDKTSDRCRLRPPTADANGRLVPHAAEHHFVSEDNLDADPAFPQDAPATSKINTTGNPE